MRKNYITNSNDQLMERWALYDARERHANNTAFPDRPTDI